MGLSVNQHQLALLTTYAAIALMLLLAIWNPSINYGKGSVDLLLLMDESDSIKPHNNDEIWTSFIQQSRSLNGDNRISLMRFADRARVAIPWISTAKTEFKKLSLNISPPRHEFIGKGASDINLAIQSAVQHSSPNRHTAIILSSDGIDNINPAQKVFPLTQHNPNISFFHLNPELSKAPVAFKIESINLPENISPGDALELSLSIESYSENQGTVEIFINDSRSYQQFIKMTSGQRKVLSVNLPVDQSTALTLKFLLRDKQGKIIDHQHRMVDIRNQRQLLYIDNRSDNLQQQFLQLAGWKTVRIKPQEIPYDRAFFDTFNIVLMDDIKATAINPEIISNLSRAIQQSGTGLIVLGGPDSFGSGGYRYSQLEQLLPVTSESSRPIPSAAFVFLLDKSGSMESSSRNNSKLADALNAVAESAKSLRTNDESALLAFDRNVTVLLPLKHRKNTLTALSKPWKLQASGGTQLAPAMKQAINQLNQSTSTKRFIILVTDGVVLKQNINELKQALQKSNIQLIALAIGDNAELSTLAELTTIKGGKVLVVEDSAQLPVFMRQQLEAGLQSWNDNIVTPQSVSQASFINKPDTSWLKIQGYQITRAKPSARVYISTAQSDPLLAISQHGAGKVAVLPGKILKMTTADNFLNSLLNWLDMQQQNPNFKVSHHYQPGQIHIMMDAINTHNNWHPATTAELMLTYPDGTTHLQQMEAIAAGRFRTVMPATVNGIYNVRIKVDNEQTSYTAYVNNDLEHRYHTTVPWLQHALSSGKIQPWTETAFNKFLTASSRQVATRPMWLLLAFISYLLLIIAERGSGINRFISSIKN